MKFIFQVIVSFSCILVEQRTLNISRTELHTELFYNMIDICLHSFTIEIIIILYQNREREREREQERV